MVPSCFDFETTVFQKAFVGLKVFDLYDDQWVYLEKIFVLYL